jgi:maleate cis-trans isomerase
MSELKGRIGYIAPATFRNPSDWNVLLPPGVGIVAVTLNVKAHKQEEFQRAIEAVRDGALTLKGEEADVIVLAGTPLATLRGRSGEGPFLSELEELTGLPTITALGASVLAMEHLNLKKISVATPYREELNAGLRKYLEESGFVITALKGCEVQRPVEADRLPPGTCTRVAREAFLTDPKADGIFLDGRWHVVQYIEDLEREFGKPVVASCPAILWWAIKTMRIQTPIERFGRLLRLPLTS